MKTVQINKNLKKFINIFAVVILIIFSVNLTSASAYDLGGEVSLMNNLSYSNSEIGAELAAELELEWYLPYNYPLDIQNRLVIKAEGSDLDFWFKKLYLRKKVASMTVKIGRQPVSWSYGALLNPVDYSLGAENLEDESRAKFVDGIELYYPINWGTGITFISTDIEGEKDHKWSLRGRTTFSGYDLSANYIKTPSSSSSGNLDRYGLTVKGDLGPFGVYGALGLWENRSIRYDIYQFGGDYSYHFLRGSQLYLQGEYILIDGAEAAEEFNFFNNIQDQNQEDSDDLNKDSVKIELLNTNISYEIDEFSSIGLMMVSYLGDGSTLFIPNYSYLFGSNLLFELRGTAAAGSEEDLLGGDQRGIELKLSYTF